MKKLLLALTALSSLAMTLAITACGPSLASMHAGAEAGHVQADAPVHVRKSIEIHASRDVVWKQLTDFAAWPKWQPGVESMRAPKSVTPGETFVWKTGGSEISSTIAIVEPGKTVGWTGAVSVAKAVHIFRIEAVSPGVTRVTDEESMDGFLLTWFYGQKDLERDMTKSLQALAHAVER
jgi:hypothetical protein